MIQPVAEFLFNIQTRHVQFLPLSQTRRLVFLSTLSRELLLASPGCVMLQIKSICCFCLGFLSDIVVWSFSQWLPQSYLQRHEGPHSHMEEDLPNVPQFIQIHVGQTDECKRQEGLAVPPH